MSIELLPPDEVWLEIFKVALMKLDKRGALETLVKNAETVADLGLEAYDRRFLGDV
jgi:hypothetical protein